MTVDVVVIGGGISGLATAHDLKRRGHRVMVLERQAKTGGNAVSERFSGFLMEHGPSTVNAFSPVGHALSSELGLDDERCDLGEGVRRRYLVGDGALQGIAVHPFGFLFSDYLSLRGRVRLMAEVAISRGRSHAEESIAEFCARRFGSEFTERVIDPLVGGLYAGRADELSVSAVFPKFVELEREYRSIILGLLRRRRRGGRMPGSRLFSWRDGIGTLPQALARELEGTIRAETAVRRVMPAPGGFKVEAARDGSVFARAVVIATQPHVTAQLLESIDVSAAAAASEIAAPPLAVVFLGYRRRDVDHPLDGLGFLTPRGEGRALTGAQFCSTMFPGRAPKGHVALAGYIGGARNPELAKLPAAQLVQVAREEFRDLLGARGPPIVSRVRHWPAGIPQYRIGHQERTGHLRRLGQRWPGLFVTGNYFNGPSVAECVSLARDTAAECHGFLDGIANRHHGWGDRRDPTSKKQEHRAVRSY